MVYRKRLDHPGAIHHVIVRGNNGNYIFKHDREKEKYLTLFVFYKKIHEVSLLAYCMMDNHAHFLIATGETHIGTFMHDVQLAYSKWFHHKKDTFGLNYSGRYKNCYCAKRGYYRNLLRYIHRNPIKAGLTTDYEYPWSSFNEYQAGSGICDLDLAYEMLGENQQDATEQFNVILSKSIEEEIEQAIMKVKSISVRDRDFIDAFFNVLEYDQKMMLGMGIEEYFLTLRMQLLEVLRWEFNVSATVIAEYFGISRSYVYRMTSG
ncbi:MULTISPECIES: transposase [unclassified Fusibacter]|uniref:transposase n=1 Tax=unclassified Fusibacter TaxID=2624464 RepID=UPI0013E942C8|nr:transposase [Fusibacter sp. A1]MCK8060374.1 transposase [Fusibacter sp. A2]NPE20337.1 hypothetical protein [Fusibacter sp. A1]